MALKPVSVNKTLPFDPSLLDVNISLRQVEEISFKISKRCVVTGINEVAWALRALMLTDLTSLSGDDTRANVRRLCVRACYPFEPQFFDKFFERTLLKDIHCAAVCVYPARVKEVFTTIQKFKHLDKVAVAAVASGFPTAQYGLQTRLQEISHAILAGATEIEVAINRQLALGGQWKELYNEMVLMRSSCGEHARMKAVLAVAELATMENVYKAAMVCMLAGADFIKTSTGAEMVNVTLPTGLVIIYAIQEFKRCTCQVVGLNASGGLRTMSDAKSWMALVIETLGSRWLTPSRFRFGASGLLEDIDLVIRAGVARMEREASEKDNQQQSHVALTKVDDSFCKELRKKQ